MSESIGDVVLPGMKVEGTTEEVAVKIFEKIISPNTEMLLKKDPQAAATFALHIMGLGISQFASCVSTKQFKQQLEIITHNMVLSLKKERGELGS
ncbi:hypothetical protein EAH57_14985 [Acinetobacter sp. 2JN-4]|uniref:hypothetical protein n=1 Tax=Acinetobacter sp. 2JN-4 TaxID=2479844 RepID=UPI000EFA0461|nr:hypothetical protein [Acinetobacter sp. 2JN-4]RLZ06832.1 hypothetical protein EAH57_14985 [Acinetobacter sp. 2JN-4]